MEKMMIMMMNHWMVWGSLFVWKQHIALDTLGWRCVGCKAKWQDIIMGRFSTGGTCFSNNWRNSRWIKWLTDIKSCFLKGKGTQAPWARGINSRFSWAFFNCPIFSNMFAFKIPRFPIFSHIPPWFPYVFPLRFHPFTGRHDVAPGSGERPLCGAAAVAAAARHRLRTDGDWRCRPCCAALRMVDECWW